MPRKTETLTLSIPPGTKEQLERIATRLDIMWGDRPSVSGLIVAIAQDQFSLSPPFQLNEVQVQSLEQATSVLVDSGYIGEAQTLAALILECGNPEPPLRQALLERVSQPMEAWRIILDRHIANRQPFRLYYRDTTQKDWEFTVCYAKIRFREKRYYLEIWSEETEGNKDIPELQHNWTFRLDRIQNLVTTPTSGTWRDGLDTIEVQLHFLDRLTTAYEPKPNDVDDRREEDLRIITRRISSTYWLLREVRAYGKNCIVVAPQSVRDRVIAEARSICQNYGLSVRE
ncbi:helix-turn-helix transcriptional regulator [Oscillatoria salina]|uniref:helix-turn-helix transcriptional regulator n=1 Tax=Oscillatoria salina TaxID=331517 RepID=UPI0013B665C3|nr:WYL domain-containing protein [Oscillatoria salina]MBZ8181933.1 WYL domain-containing protein [Oscillatoria salina IIICB1]NET89783.1 WYL domain-containing protein [Kamptonema sp. SIO1D9]